MKMEEVRTKAEEFIQRKIPMYITPQAEKVIANYPNFPWKKFCKWHLETYPTTMQINGQHIFRYMSEYINKDLEVE